MVDEKQIRWVGLRRSAGTPKRRPEGSGLPVGEGPGRACAGRLEDLRRGRCGREGDSDQGGKRYLPRDVRRQVRGSHLRTPLLPEEDSGDQQAGQGNCRGALSRRGQHEEGKEMKIDTEIRHVTKAGANRLLELGFTPDEAKSLPAASRKPINDTHLPNEQLTEAIPG